MNESQDIEIARAIEGDLNAQRFLFEAYYAYVLSISLRYMASREVAEEVLNDIFLKVFNKLKLYDKNYPFKAWIRKVAINTCIDRLRSTPKFPNWSELTIHFMGHLEDEDSDIKVGEMDEQPFLPVLQKLPPRYRAVFNLYVFEEYTHKEIGQALGIHEGTAKSNYARAKKIIKQHLEKKRSSSSPATLHFALNTDNK